MIFREINKDNLVIVHCLYQVLTGSLHCYLTVTTAPSMNNCQECVKVRQLSVCMSVCQTVCLYV